MLLALLGCRSAPTRGLTSKELQAIQAAEWFVVRNGYTEAGHPANLPVQHVSIFDVFETDQELIKNRKGLLQSCAIAVKRVKHNAFWVYFPETDAKDPRIVYVYGGEAEQLFHQSYGPVDSKAKQVATPCIPPDVSSKPLAH